MKLNKAIVGAVAGAVTGGTAGFFIGKKFAEASAASEVDNVEVTENPELIETNSASDTQDNETSSAETEVKEAE